MTRTGRERPPLLERAFALADSGRVQSTKTLRRALVEEGYGHGEVASALTGLGIRRELKARILAANPDGLD